MIENKNESHTNEGPPTGQTGDGHGRKPKLGSKNPNPHPVKDTSDSSSSQAVEPRTGAVMAKKTVSKAIANCCQLLQHIATAESGEPRLAEIGRVLKSIKSSRVMHCLVTGYCAYEKALLVVVRTGRGHEDREGRGIGASDKEVAEQSGYTQDTIADNRRIYRNCIGEPLDKISDENLRVAEQQRLVEIAATLTRTALIKCSEVVDSVRAMHKVYDYIKTYSVEELTPLELKQVLEGYARRFEANNPSQGSTGAASKAVTKPIRLSESGTATLAAFAKHLNIGDESAIELALLFCLERIEEFENRPEVRNI